MEVYDAGLFRVRAIVGVGLHSKNNQRVLYPAIYEMAKEMGYVVYEDPADIGKDTGRCGVPTLIVNGTNELYKPRR